MNLTLNSWMVVPLAVPPDSVCRGRPRRESDEFVKGSFADETNDGRDIERVGRASSHKVVLKRGCGRHFACITMDAANKRRLQHAFIHCKICADSSGPKRGKKRRRTASSYEKSAAKVLDYVFDGKTIITECHHLGKGAGPTDFTVVLDNNIDGRLLLVEVDGIQHHHKGYQGTSLEEQKQCDDEKNEMYLAAGMKVVRLHYKDESHWQDVLKEAKKLASNDPTTPFILYTLKYAKKDRLV